MQFTQDRIAKYGSADTYTLRRLRHELGTRMEGQFEAEAMVESKRDGQPPFMREKPQMLPILENTPAKLSCLAVGDPKPVVQWFKCVIHSSSIYLLSINNSAILEMKTWFLKAKE